MQIPRIALRVGARDYGKLVELATRVQSSMTGSLPFPSPSPALATVATATTALSNAIAAWGPVNNRGSHADLQNLRSSAITLHQMLKAEADYVQNTALIVAGNDYAEMAALITSSGFGLATAKNPQGLLEPVRNLHRVLSRSLTINKVKLNWLKPLDLTSANNVKSFWIYRGVTAVFTDAVQIAATTKTTYTDTNTTGSTQNWIYWVVPFNAAGAGGNGEPIAVTVSAI